MAGSRNQERMRPPLWDRLTADHPTVASGALRIEPHEMVSSVRNDIERLLNTRRTDLLDVDHLPEAQRSLLAYGLPDLAMYSGRSSTDRRTICELIADVLRRFEPRLVPSSIRVDYIAGGTAVGTPDACRAQFRIRAVLHVDPLRLPVAFDTAVDMETSMVKLEDTADA